MIAESIDLSCGQRRSVEAHRFHAEEGSMDRLKRAVGGKLGAFDAVLPVDPLVALEESPAPGRTSN